MGRPRCQSLPLCQPIVEGEVAGYRFAPAEEVPEENCYNAIEGGLGWWQDTHFPASPPKFIMGGVGPNFSVIANSPGYGAGTWGKPRGHYGVAQLISYLLMPLDGLNLKQSTTSLDGGWALHLRGPNRLLCSEGRQVRWD